MDRLNKHMYYLKIAEQVSKRSTCLRRQYGAVIVKNDEIVSTGYNGGPRGQINCSDIGVCYRASQNVPHGERYELCQSVHAEANAIISASRSEMIGSTLYLVGFDIDPKTLEQIPVWDAEPCFMCKRLILNAGIENVVHWAADKTVQIDTV